MLMFVARVSETSQFVVLTRWL